MSHLVWTDSLNTGIDVIDGQHRKIVDYINQLHDSRHVVDRSIVGSIIEAMVEYTISHFGFEETLMEEAGYEYLRPHKKVHELFIKRVADLRQRYNGGEDVLDELQGLLTRWLFNHIRDDDSGYVKAVKPQIQELVKETSQASWLSRTLGRFFLTK